MKRIDGRKQDELRPVGDRSQYQQICGGLLPDPLRQHPCAVHRQCGGQAAPPRPRGGGLGHRRVLHAPRANRERSRRDISKLKLNGRSAEIQRLIGRALRSVVDMKKLGPWNITIDCDVLQGDGGTRTASITGGFVAMMLAFRKMMEAGQLAEYPISGYVAAVSAGIVDDVPLLDLCYEEDSAAMVDLNCVMDDQGRLIEIQGTGEERPFTLDEQRQLVELCEKGIRRLQAVQRAVLEG